MRRNMHVTHDRVLAVSHHLGLEITKVARTTVSHVGSRSRHLGLEELLRVVVVRSNHHRARVVDILRSRGR
jgi:hypothetical protein